MARFNIMEILNFEEINCRKQIVITTAPLQTIADI
jgi:hypothetical protein